MADDDASEESHPEQAAVEDEAPIDPDSLRADPRVASELFGVLYTGVTAHGPAQFGNYNTQHNHYGKQSPAPIIGELPDIEELMARYVPTGADEQLDDLISQRPTLCLVGPRHSGRYSTARAALARRYKSGHVYEIALPTGVSPEALAGKPDRLPEQSGFVLRLAGGGHGESMRKLAALFRQRHSTLLLIKDEEPRQWDRHGAEVRHRPADPADVFRSHLAASLPDAEGYVQDMEAELKALSGPKEAVFLARAIAKERPAGAESLRAILDRLQSRRRERAAAILLPGTDGSAARSRRAGQHERAFRLSYAVFHRRSLHYVFEGAGSLLREIDSAALRPDWGSMALQHPVQDLLGGELRQDWAYGREADDTTRGASRTAWIRDEGLRAAIIDVAWHEFDGTRRPLLKWLDGLVAGGDTVTRQAAAETAALLAHHDFKRVQRDLVDGWAGSRRADVRQTAAWAMTYSGTSSDVGSLVRARLNDWCAGSSTFRHDTAARIYASGLEQAVPAWSMFDLARIAQDRMQQRRHVVAEALNQLYRPERAGWLLAELDTWTRTPMLQVHAARALPALATRDTPDGPPDLLARLGEGSIDIRQLGRLWLTAFLEPGTAGKAADALARWIRHTDANEEFRGQLAALRDEIGAVPAMRRRVEFYLKRTFGTREERRRTP